MEGIRRSINGACLMAGTIIGVGLFGLPYVAARAGFMPTVIHILVLSGVGFLTAAMYAEVVVRYPQRMRLPGYVGASLGPRWRRLAIASNTVGLFGALAAYVMVGGNFLAGMLQPVFGGPAWLYVTGYYAVGIAVIWAGQRAVVGMEVALLLVFFLIMAWLVARLSPYVQWEQWGGVRWGSLLFPYGVALFSIWGVSIVPDVVDEVGARYRRRLPWVLAASTALAALTYILFTAVVLGVSGAQTSPESIAGLRVRLSPSGIALLYVFGLITTFTSFISLGALLQKVFWFDLKRTKGTALAAVAAVPALFIFAPPTVFISVIGITGALALGVDAYLILRVYRHLRGQPQVITAIPRLIDFLLPALLGAGIAAELGSLTVESLRH
ncbi:MAG: aromatic amino acid transport family protein [bacterium]|nr:aromatic amino acid transport family protein [bacterium]